MKRNKLKTIFLHVIVITIIGGLFCHGYIMGNCLSLGDRINCYAETSPATRDDVINSFKAYCRDRNLLIDGTLAGSAFEWTGSAINSALGAIGVDMDYLQAQISKETGGNIGVRWLVNATGMNIYNRLFAELLQRESLEVGDENVDKTVFSGKSITIDNNRYLVWVLNQDAGGGYVNYPNPRIVSYGTFINDGSFFNILYNNGTTSYQYPFCNSSVNIVHTVTSVHDYIRYSAPIYGTYSNSEIINAGTFFYTVGNGDIKIGAYSEFINSSNVRRCILSLVGSLTSDYNNPDNIDDTDITVTTPPDKKILPDPPDDDTTIYHDPSDNPDNPGGGGDDPGGGGDPDDWEPTVPDIPDPETPDFPTIDLPDIDIPDLPSLNFSLGDLRNKFPFSLPFDIIAVLNVLDGEPQAPHIQATIPIGKWYTWEMDFDFSEFDNYARLFRAFEFIGFVIGLAVFTVHFAKG